MFVALEPRRLYRLVAEQIRLLIESGELTDGQRLLKRSAIWRNVLACPARRCGKR